MHLGAAPDYRDQCACNFMFAAFNLSLCTVVRSCNGILSGGLKYCLFLPLPGEMIQFDYMIFFKWVETTN